MDKVFAFPIPRQIFICTHKHLLLKTDAAMPDTLPWKAHMR